MKQKLIIFMALVLGLWIFSSAMYLVLSANTQTNYVETYNFPVEQGSTSEKVTFIDTAAMVTDLEFIDVYLDYNDADINNPIVENGVLTTHGENNDYYLEIDANGLVIKNLVESDFEIRFDREQRSVITTSVQASFSLKIDYNFVIEDYVGNTIFPIEITDNYDPNTEGSILVQNAYNAPIGWTYWAEETATVEVIVFDERSIYAGADITYDTSPYQGPTFDYTQRRFTFTQYNETTNLTINFSTQELNLDYNNNHVDILFDTNDGQGQRDASQENTNIGLNIYVFEGLEIDFEVISSNEDYRLDYYEYPNWNNNGTLTTSSENPFTYVVGESSLDTITFYSTEADTPYIETYQFPTHQGSTYREVTFIDTAAMVNNLETIDVYLDYYGADINTPIVENGVLTTHGENNDYYLETDANGLVIKNGFDINFEIRFDIEQRSVITTSVESSYTLTIDYNLNLEDYVNNTIYEFIIIDNHTPNLEGIISIPSLWPAPEHWTYWVEPGVDISPIIKTENSIYAGAKVFYEPLPSQEITFDYTEKQITFEMAATTTYLEVDFSTQELLLDYNTNRLQVMADLKDGNGFVDVTELNSNIGSAIYVFEDLNIEFKVIADQTKYGLDYYQYYNWYAGGEFSTADDNPFTFQVGPYNESIVFHVTELIPIELISIPSPNLGIIVAEGYYIELDEEYNRILYAPPGDNVTLTVQFLEEYRINYWTVRFFDENADTYLTATIDNEYDGEVDIIPTGDRKSITITIPENNPPTIRVFLAEDIYGIDDEPDSSYQEFMEKYNLWSSGGRTLIFFISITLITIPMAMTKSDSLTYIIVYLIISTFFSIVGWVPFFVAFPILSILVTLGFISLKGGA